MQQIQCRNNPFCIWGFAIEKAGKDWLEQTSYIILTQ